MGLVNWQLESHCTLDGGVCQPRGYQPSDQVAWHGRQAAFARAALYTPRIAYGALGAQTQPKAASAAEVARREAQSRCKAATFLGRLRTANPARCLLTREMVK